LRALAAAVAAVGLTAVDIHAVGVGHANAPACGRQQVGNQPVVVVLLLFGHVMTDVAVVAWRKQLIDP
jgi:hypothetical protein